MKRKHGRLLLLMIAATCVVVWLAVLPQFANWQPLKELIVRQRAQGIDPSAMYYSEVEAMPEIWRRTAIATTALPNADR